MTKKKDSDLQNLPVCAAEYIRLVIKKMRYHKNVRAEVAQELARHFEDELKDCTTDEEKDKKAQEIIAEFGDVKLLGKLLRRAKKRCRPLWRKAIVRSFQVLGIIFLYLLICFSPLIIGKPTISVDYIDWLNQLVSADRDDSQNARPYYEKAIDVCIEMPDWLSKSKVKWPTDFNDVEVNGLTRWLNDNKQTLELIKKAVELPYYWNDYQSPFSKSETSFLHANVSIMKSLTGYKKLAYLLKWQVRYQVYLGDIDTALDDCIVLQKLCSHMQGKGLLIEQLVGAAIEALAHHEVLIIMQRTDVPSESLETVQRNLEREFGREKSVIDLEAEKAFWYDYIQLTFTDDGKGGGRPLIRGIPFAVKDWREGIWGLISFNYPDRRQVTATIDNYFQQAEELLQKTPWQLHLNEELQEWNQIGKECFMLQMLGPTHSRIGKVIWRLKTSRAGLLTVLATLRYDKEKGQYPAGLTELVSAGYLKKLPMDPFSDGMLVYKKMDDDFILYSLGRNFKDDGGEVFRDDRGRNQIWGRDDKGDAVFWPVPRE